MVKNFEDMFIGFDTMYEHDRHTDGHHMTANVALDASIARQKPTCCPISYQYNTTGFTNYFFGHTIIITLFTLGTYIPEGV